MKGTIEIGSNTVDENENLKLSNKSLEKEVSGSISILPYPKEHKVLIVNGDKNENLPVNDFASKVSKLLVRGRCVVLTGNDYHDYINMVVSIK